MSRTIDAIARYDQGKKWGKTKETDGLVERFRQANGLVIDGDYIVVLSVVDINGSPISVTIYPAAPVDYAAPWYYRVGSWTGEEMADGFGLVAQDGRAEITDELIQFAAEHGVNVDKALLAAHIENVRRGFKVQTALGDGWSVFSPIPDNDVRLKFSRDNGKSYIA